MAGDVLGLSVVLAGVVGALYILYRFYNNGV
jgi:hypothetical protein